MDKFTGALIGFNNFCYNKRFSLITGLGIYASGAFLGVGNIPFAIIVFLSTLLIHYVSGKFENDSLQNYKKNEKVVNNE